MSKNKLFSTFLILATIYFSTPCFGQKSPSSETKPKGSRKVKVSFGDELVKGASEKPDISNFNTKTDFNYKKLIRVRENFLNEMEGGLDDFKGN